MPGIEPIEMRPVILQYTGLFDFDGMYAALIDWAKNYGYHWHERVYKHKVPDVGAEQEFVWMMTKKATEFVHFKIELNVHTWDMQDVDVAVEGKKKALTNVRMLMRITGMLTLDWQKRFGGSKFREFLGRTYYKLLKKDFESVYYDMLYYRIWNLHAVLKKYCDMQSKYYAYKGYLKEH